MAHDPRHQRALSPEEVATEVAAILAAAERDARATIESARRLPAGLAPPAGSAPPHNGEPSPGSIDIASASAVSQLDQRLAALIGAVEVLRRRIETVELRLAELADGSPGAAAAPAPGMSAPPTSERGRTERVRAVDLALRGLSREQIAAELRGSLDEPEIERLLDDVLERA